MKLEIGKQYYLNSDGQFCHCFNVNGSKNISGNVPYNYLGEVALLNGERRNIFISSNYDTEYAMFDVKAPERYAKEVKNFSKILEKIEKLEQELEDLKKLIK